MKRNSPTDLSNGSCENLEKADPLTKEDALWDLLGSASELKADAFFARNTVREVRQLADTQPTRGERLTGFFFTKKAILPLAAAACLGVIAVTQFGSDQPVATQPDPIVQADPVEDPSTALAELVIEESLVAAAEDPSQFTHDEVVAMIGL